jgi:hypothetical protein
MNIDTIKNKITELSLEHHSIDDGYFEEIKSAELLESQAQDLIIEYCVSRNYLINGFPTLKEQMGEEYDEDYFTMERYQLYLDRLSLEKDDVAELTWCYVSSFWPGWFDDKEEFIENIQHQIKIGNFYSVDLD